MAAVIRAVVSVCLVALMATQSICAFDTPSVDITNLSPLELASRLESMEEEQLTADPGRVPPEVFSTDGQDLGSVSAVDVDSQGNLWAFHRADRPWTERTFRYQSAELTEEGRVPIGSDTILKLDPESGKIISKFGANLFNVPHGLKIDKDDNVWVTDVGRHQVLRFPNDSSTPDLVLGEKFIPGRDESHFCKPTDVAIASNGEFFVSDGYCNSRILKFSKDGTLLAMWGTQTGFIGPVTPYHMDIPHSITLVEHLDIVCVADRENQRANCFNAGLGSDRQLGAFNRELIEQGEIGKVFAVYYNKADDTIVAAGEIAQTPYFDGMALTYPPRGFTFSVTGDLVNVWAPITPLMVVDGLSLIHDLCTSHDGKDFFLADSIQGKVFKYSRTKPGVGQA